MTRHTSAGCGVCDSSGGTATGRLEAGGRQLNTVCVAAGPETPQSLLQNLQLCVLPSVSLPALVLLLLQIHRFIKELHSSG